MKSRYDQLAHAAEEPKVSWTRWGISESEWETMTAEAREIHYNRQKICEHPYVFEGAPELREAYSRDPYFHSLHSPAHTAAGFFAGTCACNDCVHGTGLVGAQLVHHGQRRGAAKLKLIGSPKHSERALDRTS